MSTDKKFASQADLADKNVSFDKLSDHAYAFTAEGDPNTGIIVGDDAVLVADTQATPVMAQEVIRRIRQVTAKPIRYVVLTHYHAVRVLGASAYGAEHIIASEDTRELIVERGEADMKSEIERFPRLFQAVESVPGLTWPTLTFRGEMTLWLGTLEVKLMQLGRGHTLDAIAALEPRKLVPGRGAALMTPDQVREGLAQTRAFISDLYAAVKRDAAAGRDLRSVYQRAYSELKPRYGNWVIYDHCMPFDVSRAYDQATRYPDPRIWTAQRDKEMWDQLEG